MKHSNISHLSELFGKVKWLASTKGRIVCSLKEGDKIDDNFSATQAGIWGLIPKPRNPDTFMRVFLGENEQAAEKFLKDHWNSKELAARYGAAITADMVETGYTS